MARLLTTAGRLRLGGLRGRIAILLTCMSTLEEQIEEGAGRRARLELDALDARRGRQGVDKALSSYRAWIRGPAAWSRPVSP